MMAQSISSDAPLIDAALNHVAVGGSMNPTPIELSPNKADIAAHLYALFSPAFVQPYPDAWIEIAWSDPADGDLNRARKFSAHDLKPIADFAERKSQAGCNVYVGAALRQGEMPPKGRASDNNFQAAAFAWAEFDGDGDGERRRLRHIVDEIVEGGIRVGIRPAVGVILPVVVVG